MKSVRSDEPCKPEVTYPCLMISEKGRVVLFTGRGVGTMVNYGDEPVGQWADNWGMEVFTTYTGSVTLSN